MQVTYELQLADWKAFSRFFALRHKANRSASRGWWLVRAIFALFLLPGIVSPLYYFDSPQFKTAWKANGIVALWPLCLVVIPIAVLALAWFGAPLLQNLAFRESPHYKKQLALSIEKDGLRGERLTPWNQVREVAQSPTHIFIVLTNNTVIIIPKRAFETDFAAIQFAANCQDWSTQ